MPPMNETINKQTEDALATSSNGQRYWKSLDDLAETPAFKDWMHREFPSGASEMEGVNRRHFLKIMAASFGLAGLGMTGCRRPEKVILAYSNQPELLIPGVPVFYTSSIPSAKDSVPLIVETHQARPTKIEGNPSYRPYRGATDVFTQASVLDMYDPDRATDSRAAGSRINRAAVRDRLAELRRKHRSDNGAGLVFLAEGSSSPSRARMVEELKAAFPEALWAEYEPIALDGAEKAFAAINGNPLRVLPNLEKASRVLSIDADFVQTMPGKLGFARGFAQGRKVYNADEADKMSRLYSVEANLSLTGSMADHRLRLGSSQMAAFTALLAAEIFRITGQGGALSGLLAGLDTNLEVDPAWITACAQDLVEQRGRSLVLAGDHLPASAHALVYAINLALGANGETVNYVEAPAHAEGIDAVAARLEAGDVETLFILGGNPVYDAPADLDWDALQAKAGQTVHFSYYHNETTAKADLHIARSHYLECWGDSRTFDGTVLPVQPMIDPIFRTFNELEVLARLAGLSTTDAYEITRATIDGLTDGSETAFRRFLSNGLLADSQFAAVENSLNYAALADAIDADELMAPDLSAEALEVIFAPSQHTWDGRYANNGWMQECPEPLTKLTWENAILISPRLARALEAESGVRIIPDKTLLMKDGPLNRLTQQSATFERGRQVTPVAELTVNGRTIKAPVHVVPGLANHSIVLPLGFGREVSGRVGTGNGFNAYKVRGGSNLALDGRLKLTSERVTIANAQEHWSMEGRAIIREGNLEEWKEEPNFANKMGMESHSPPIYGKDKDKSVQYKVTQQPRGGSAHEIPKFTDPMPNVPIWNRDGVRDKFPEPQQWGMVIDLNSCTGCNACVVACQSENNIPIVGRDQVLRGREMHWIRLDRYFSGAQDDTNDIPEDVQVSFMGVACQHCENAPCETVCPVNATVHDEQGLNTMAYNRCVGTRYCANNCPYKVRRFNFFDWNKRDINELYKGPLGRVDEPELGKMQKNPNVTVRMRGVMEKCTYCTQRIETAKHDQKRIAGASGNVRVPDGRIKTACQQVCPTEAIVFGDLSDAETQVSKLRESDRDYSLLGYLNVRPRTTFLARVRNPNMAIPNAPKAPFTRQAYKARQPKPLAR
ncbi:MAG: 4Fe-4S dicluster domain-containing protein [Puniceicoccaceae bacterium]|nr:MAG: 4Fe-4S dicluster domain-containing protein [Puniceicoccaceae bacterium]